MTMPDTDGFLFHYTSVGTATQIVKTRQLWATNIYYLNDGSELTYGIGLMRRCLERFARRKRAAAVFLEDVDWSAHRSPRLTVFVVSFSEAGDLLSQWRAYCPPNRGISLGFELEDLQQSAAAQGFELVRCSYSPRKQTIEARRIARHWIARYESVTTEVERAEVKESFGLAFARTAASFKDASFQAEREWRLVAIRSDDPGTLKYREGTSTLIPYITFDLPVDSKDRLRMRRVIVGPSLHWELAYNAVGKMIMGSKVLYGHIDPSRTPFRAW